jgi:uncharacterized repeat protein (TIGR03803 family)
MKTQPRILLAVIARCVLCLLIFGALQIASAQTNFQTLISYGTGGLTGTNLNAGYAALIEGGDGRLYGVTQRGGSNLAGIVFALNKDGGGATVLRHFSYLPFSNPSSPGTNGSQPYGTLVQDSDGNLYGTTQYGGDFTCLCGVIFKLSTNGSGFTVLFTASNSASGYYPRTLVGGGADGIFAAGEGGNFFDGVLYRINPGIPGVSLFHPNALASVDGLFFLSPDSLLYGPSENSLFKINTNGTGLTIVRTFVDSSEDEDGVVLSVTEGSDSRLYGTSWDYGTNIGTLFKLDKNGSNYTNLHTFTGAPGDGANPNGVIEANGALYGTTSDGGRNNVGTIFKIGLDGSSYSILYHFSTTGGGGYSPTAPLMQASDGNFYGNTISGGDAGAGTIFRLSDAPGGGGSPTLQFSLSGNSLQLSWPANFLGWRLQTQTNAPGIGLTSSWNTITNSALTNLWTLPLNPAVGSVFVRLAPP